MSRTTTGRGGSAPGSDGAADSTDVVSRIDPYIRALGRGLVSTVPQLEGPLSTCRGWYAHAYIRYVQRRHARRYVAPIDPYRIAWVDADRIEYVAEPTRIPRFRCAGAVVDGDWDRTGVRFTDLDVYRAFEMRFEEGREWSETPFFDRVLDEIRAGEEPWGCDSRAALEDRCARLDRLYETIATEGFRTQPELMAEEADDPIGSRRRSEICRRINDEIAIDVARDGELLFADGRNRLAIAKLLGVEEIPVLILRRHAEWIPFRDRVAEHVEETGVLPSALGDHPDLEQLAPE